MNKQTMGFGPAILILLAGFVGWYALTATNAFLYAWLSAGPLALYMFVIGVLFLPLAPVPAVGGIIFLFSLKRKYPLSLWLAWGVLTAYLFNFLASILFPPLLAYSFDNIPLDLTRPNGFMLAYFGVPFFMR